MRMFLPLLILAAAACSDGKAPDRSAAASGEAPAVELAGPVTDAAFILEPREEARISARLAELRSATGHQMVVVTVSSLRGEDIAQFATDLGNAWGIGSAEKDDGLLLVVAPGERKARIAVGTGLEATLSNAECSRILADHIIPRLREGDMAGGIEAGVTALAAHLRRA